MKPNTLTVKQRRFVHLVKQGYPPYRAYPMAGYKPSESSPYRMLGLERVKRALKALDRDIMEETRVTVASISAQLEEDRAFAQSVGQAGPALNATISKAKLHGLLVDRKEVGQPGDFAALQSVDDVLAAIRRELGEDAAAALLAMAGKAPAPSPPQILTIASSEYTAG